MPTDTTSVVTLDPTREQEIMGAVKQTEQGGYINLAPDRVKKIINSVESEVAKLEEMDKVAYSKGEGMVG
jgi:flagellar biosynthesis protein FlhA